MSRHSSLARSVVMVAFLSLSPALASAQTKGHSAELGLGYAFTNFDTQTGLASRLSPSLLVGYNLTKRHGAELIYSSATATPEKRESFQVDIDTLRLGYVFNAYPKPKVVSFFRFGVGIFALDPEEHLKGPSKLEEAKTSFMIYSGGGFRWFITETVGIRLAASIDFINAANGIANADVQGAGDLGVVFVMGGREAAEKPAEEKKTP